MNAFKYGAPHGGLAFRFSTGSARSSAVGVDPRLHRLPKNNNGRDMMLDAPGYIDQARTDELHIQLVKPEE